MAKIGLWSVIARADTIARTPLDVFSGRTPIVTFGKTWRTLIRLKWGKRLRQVPLPPRAGEFSVTEGGAFHFNERDAKLPIRIDYEYTPK